MAGGRREKMAFFCLILPHSDLWFVTAAVRDAVKRRLIGFDAVKHLLQARIEKRPAISTSRATRICSSPS